MNRREPKEWSRKIFYDDLLECWVWQVRSYGDILEDGREDTRKEARKESKKTLERMTR